MPFSWSTDTTLIESKSEDNRDLETLIRRTLDGWHFTDEHRLVNVSVFKDAYGKMSALITRQSAHGSEY